MIRKLLQTYADTRPIRLIQHDGRPILKRYFVAQLPTWLGGWRVYLHHFIGDDPDGLHNHPWIYGASIVLVGWYWDQRRWGIKKVRWINVVNGDTLHRVILPEEFTSDPYTKRTSWSLFIHSPRRMDWGFIRESINNGPYIQDYELVGREVPTPFSDWYKHAPTGREWEEEQLRLTKTNRIQYKDVLINKIPTRIRLPDAD